MKAQLSRNHSVLNPPSELTKIGIVGGGPGGLMTAYFLQKKLSVPVEITIFESTSRFGGKVQTLEFETAAVKYEAGAAEFYDYSCIDHDSLKDLIQELGLMIAPMGGNSVVLDDHILGTLDDVEQYLGGGSRRELERFYCRARSMVSTADFYDSQGEEPPTLIEPERSFDDLLNEIQTSATKRYVQRLIHSDLATSPTNTNITYGLHNFLMNDANYMQLYGIVGGNEQLVQALQGAVSAAFRPDTSVERVYRLQSGKFGVDFKRKNSLNPSQISSDNQLADNRPTTKSLSQKGADSLRRGSEKTSILTSPPKGQTPFGIGSKCRPRAIDGICEKNSPSTNRSESQLETGVFDYVVIALPLDHLQKLEYGGTVLNSAIKEHVRHFDFPAHYLRITILFERPFWQGLLADSFCMLEAFGGCCLYDESTRALESKYGVLGWLLAGEAAEKHAGYSDEQLIELAIESLPSIFSEAKQLFREGKIHRWLGAVNGMPGGRTACPLDRRHQPEPLHHGNLFFVGDYLFDSTINGVLDSADYVSDWLASNLNQAC